MKHLKRFNESIDIETIKDIFLEVIDTDKVTLNIEEMTDEFRGPSGNYDLMTVGWIFTIDMGISTISKGNPYSGDEISIFEEIEEISKFSKLINEINPSILECIERVKDAGYIITYFEFGGGNLLRYKFAVSNQNEEI